MTYYEIRDRVPCKEIDTLTVAAARVWLQRNGWTLCDSSRGVGVEYEDWWRGDGNFVAVAVSPEKTRDHGQRMAELVSEVVLATGKRAAGVIAEICAIAEWQKRCAEWVEPKGTCSHCWACECQLADAWEAPGGLNPPFVMSCPTCGNGRCPRATDHRHECSGSNEPGQKGSRYT